MTKDTFSVQLGGKTKTGVVKLMDRYDLDKSEALRRCISRGLEDMGVIEDKPTTLETVLYYVSLGLAFVAGLWLLVTFLGPGEWLFESAMMAMVGIVIRIIADQEPHVSYKLRLVDLPKRKEDKIEWGEE